MRSPDWTAREHETSPDAEWIVRLVVPCFGEMQPDDDWLIWLAKFLGVAWEALLT